jgi:hypothetical protein
MDAVSRRRTLFAHHGISPRGGVLRRSQSQAQFFVRAGYAVIPRRLVCLMLMLFCTYGLSTAAVDNDQQSSRSLQKKPTLSTRNIHRQQQRYLETVTNRSSSNTTTTTTTTTTTGANHRRHAYVTLLYGKRGFYMPARVLGQSLRDTGTTADLVLLVTTDVPEPVRSVFVKDVGLSKQWRP